MNLALIAPPKQINAIFNILAHSIKPLSQVNEELTPKRSEQIHLISRYITSSTKHAAQLQALELVNPQMKNAIRLNYQMNLYTKLIDKFFRDLFITYSLLDNKNTLCTFKSIELYDTWLSEQLYVIDLVTLEKSLKDYFAEQFHKWEKLRKEELSKLLEKYGDLVNDPEEENESRDIVKARKDQKKLDYKFSFDQVHDAFLSRLFLCLNKTSDGHSMLPNMRQMNINLTDQWLCERKNYISFNNSAESSEYLREIGFYSAVYREGKDPIMLNLYCNIFANLNSLEIANDLCSKIYSQFYVEGKQNDSYLPPINHIKILRLHLKKLDNCRTFLVNTKARSIKMLEGSQNFLTVNFAYGSSFLQDISFHKDLIMLPSYFLGNANTIIELDLSETEVESVDFRALVGCSNLRKISFPNSMKIIGASCCNDLSKLVKMDISNTEIVSVGRDFCANCVSLEECLFPNTLNYIGASCFWGCKALKKLDMSELNNLRDIDDGFGDESGLEEIFMPNNLEHIGKNFGKSSLKWPKVKLDIKRNSWTDKTFHIVPNFDKFWEIIYYRPAKSAYKPKSRLTNILNKIPETANLSEKQWWKYRRNILDNSPLLKPLHKS